VDLSRCAPRSPNVEMLGMVSLARTIDKARAFNADRLGDYEYNCPHDIAVFEFLGTDARTFARQVDHLQSDEAIASWVASNLLARKTFAEIAAFNNERRSWAPEPGTQSASYFYEMRRRIAPHRENLHTWFELIEYEEGHVLELSSA
jgi:hypothetical protein